MHPQNTSVRSFMCCMAPTTKKEPTTTRIIFLMLKSYDIFTSRWRMKLRSTSHVHKFIPKIWNNLNLNVYNTITHGISISRFNYHSILLFQLRTTSHAHKFISKIWNNFNLDVHIKIQSDHHKNPPSLKIINSIFLSQGDSIQYIINIAIFKTFILQIRRI